MTFAARVRSAGTGRSRPSVVARMAATVFSATVSTVVAVVLTAPPAAAHGSGEHDTTSDFRTRLTSVPDVPGLSVRTVGLDGALRLTWTGDGTVVVLGYDDEPYLRFDDTGVWGNRRSPATYLNEDRFAAVTAPADADPTAAPAWEQLTDGSSYTWHDHRSHWMSPAPRTTPGPRAANAR